uniref:Uncharacterized protein n=1 Tax=Strigamia maritima TaxID=126957 RepID=T1JP08_STRMM
MCNLKDKYINLLSRTISSKNFNYVFIIEIPNDWQSAYGERNSLNVMEVSEKSRSKACHWMDNSGLACVLFILFPMDVISNSFFREELKESKHYIEVHHLNFKFNPLDVAEIFAGVRNIAAANKFFVLAYKTAHVCVSANLLPVGGSLVLALPVFPRLAPICFLVANSVADEKKIDELYAVRSGHRTAPRNISGAQSVWPTEVPLTWIVLCPDRGRTVRRICPDCTAYTFRFIYRACADVLLFDKFPYAAKTQKNHDFKAKRKTESRDFFVCGNLGTIIFGLKKTDRFYDRVFIVTSHRQRLKGDLNAWEFIRVTSTCTHLIKHLLFRDGVGRDAKELYIAAVPYLDVPKLLLLPVNFILLFVSTFWEVLADSELHYWVIDADS